MTSPGRISHRTTLPPPGTLTRVSTVASLLLAPNANPWTFEGTNTWILSSNAGDTYVVVDPGPDDDTHLAAVAESVRDRSEVEIWLTHHHGDHAGGAKRLGDMLNARIRCAHDDYDGIPLQDGEMLQVGSSKVQVLATPGHSADSVCFHLLDDHSVLTGDTLLGGGSPVVTPGLMGQMLESLRALASLGSTAPLGLPGHGAVIPDVHRAATHRLTARHERLKQLSSLLDKGFDDTAALVAEMYPHLDGWELVRAATGTVNAMRRYLDDGGVIDSTVTTVR